MSEGECITTSRSVLATAAILGALAVVMGAFGSHALRYRVSADLLSTWRTAVEYQMFHALALLALALAGHRGASYRWASRLWVAGVILFSGSLYSLVLFGIRSIGMLTPFGGLCFIAGWLYLLVAARKRT